MTLYVGGVSHFVTICELLVLVSLLVSDYKLVN